MNIELSAFYSRLGSILLILILGFILGRTGLIHKNTNRQLVNLLLFVFMPASLFMAFPTSFDANSADIFFAGLIAGFAVMLMLAILSKLIFNKHFYRSNFRYEAQFALIFNNATFLGYPIVSTTFGGEGIIAYCGFIIAFNLALFSYGVYLFKHKFTLKMLRDTLLNPNIIAVVLGMILFLTSFTLPSFITDAVSFVGGATTPLSVICIGFMLSEANLRQVIKKWKLLVPAIIQLIVGPTVTSLFLRLLNFPDIVISVCTLIQALPTATSLGLFATEYGGNEIEASELVAASTVLSFATMPVMILVLLG